MKLLNTLTPHRHRTLGTLSHDLDQDYFEEIVRSGGKVTAVIDWTDNSKVQKIREYLYTYVGGALDTETVKQYDVEGGLLETLVFQYNRTGPQVDSVDVTRT